MLERTGVTKHLTKLWFHPLNHNFSLAALGIYFRKRRKKNFVKLVCTILFVIISLPKKEEKKHDI